MRRSLVLALALLPWIAPLAAPLARGASLSLEGQVQRDSTGAPLRFPEGVACDGSRLAVADTGNSRVVLFDVDDGQVLGGTPLVIPETPVPIRLAFRPDGGLLVLDGRSRRVGRVATSGAFEGWLAPAGAGGMTPRSVKVVGDGATYLLDAGKRRVLVLDGAGSLTREIALPDSMRSAADLAADASGAVWVVDGIDFALYKADVEATRASKLADLPRDRIELAHALALDRAGRLLLVDRAGGRIALLGQDGSLRSTLLAMGWQPGELRYPGSLCVDPNGLVFVADRENQRVQVFALAD